MPLPIPSHSERGSIEILANPCHAYADRVHGYPSERCRCQSRTRCQYADRVHGYPSERCRCQSRTRCQYADRVHGYPPERGLD